MPTSTLPAARQQPVSCTTRRRCGAATALGPPGELGGRVVLGRHPHPGPTAPRIVPAVIEFLHGPLAENSHRVGKALRDDFAGLHSAHRGSYRVLYEINEAEHTVTVTRVADRGDSYRPR